MWGEWILAYAHAIQPGQKEFEADTGDGEVLAIPLDSEKSATENAQTYFARYRKAQRAAKDVPTRLDDTLLALRDLEQLESDLTLASTRPEIDRVRGALVEAGYVRAKKAKGSKVTPGKPLSVESPDGLTILVGRNSRQNDQVTFRQGKSSDSWFHARGVPGAHVLVRGAEQPPPQATIQRAAELAAYYSPLRNETDVLVDYTQRRYVRRIPRAAPGLVTYSKEKTIRVAPRGAD
jgi:predicted ribosome quality control (RQC) complex YloA/Tae2 family protein